MGRFSFALRFTMVILFILTAVTPASAKEKEGYQTAFVDWKASTRGFDQWSLTAIRVADGGTLEIIPESATAGTDPYQAGAYYGGNYYNGGSFYFGEATSPEMSASFDLREAIASWNADTPPGTWIEVDISVRLNGRWTKWYILGIWDDDNSTIQRHSVKLQGDNDGYVGVDTLVLTNKKETAEAFRLKFKLFSDDNTTSPTVRYASVAYSTTSPKKANVSGGNPALWNTRLEVPECSQMVYPDGGNVWCSPTSTSMVLMYWNQNGRPCNEWVPATVTGVFDWVYDGHGNWPFNTAYAATMNASGDPDHLEASVRRFTSLAEAEPWVTAGVPVIVSYAWSKNALTGAAVPSSDGHLSVLVGFDGSGNPIINDPAASSDEDVQRTYLRSEFEPLWLQATGGTVYLIYPPDLVTP
jgi:hypothetical protein